VKLLRTILLYPFTPAKRRLGLTEHLIIDAMILVVVCGLARLVFGEFHRGAVTGAVVGTLLSTAFSLWRDRNAPL
jgi:hypothetical protein